MTLYKGNKKISELYVGGTSIGKLYKGSTLVWKKSGGDNDNYFVWREIDDEGNLTLATGEFPNELYADIKEIGNYGLNYAFYYCTGLVGRVEFASLTKIGIMGFYYAFSGCTGLTEVYFPALTSSHSSGLAGAFYGCTGITEIHFRADAQALIEALDGYSNKFRATNATIYFDL
jgi:hypothetical protein